MSRLDSASVDGKPPCLSSFVGMAPPSSIARLLLRSGSFALSVGLKPADNTVMDDVGGTPSGFHFSSGFQAENQEALPVVLL